MSGAAKRILEALDKTEAPVARPERSAAKKPKSGLKHIGGYFEKEDVFKFNYLKTELELDNSELIKRAIDELHARVLARQAFD